MIEDPGPPAGAAALPAGATAQPARAGSPTTRAIARAGIIVTLLFLASRVLGYVRTIAIAGSVPDVGDLAPFFAAFRIPDLLFQLVAAGALSSALIPIMAALLATDEEARAWRVVSTVATLVLAVLAALAGLVLLVAPALVALITPGFDAAQLEETTRLTRIMVLAPLFLALGAVATSALNARGRFASAALAPLVYNAAIIVAAIVLVPVMGTTGLAVGVVAGAVGHALVQLPALVRLGARLRPRIGLGDPQARLALGLMVPRAIGLGATQLVFVVMTSLASTLGAEALPVFNFAFAVLQIPIGVIGVPLGVVLLPSLSREAASGTGEEYTRLLVRGLAILGYAMVGITALGIVAAEDVVRLLFSVADISESAIEATGVALGVFLAGLTAHSLIAILARAFYALKDTRTPVLAALGAVVANIVIANLLVGPLGLNGLAAAIAISAWLETLALVALLRGRVPGYGPGVRHVAGVLARSVAVATAGGAAAWLVMAALLQAWGEDPGLVGLFARASLVTLAGGLVILAGSVALRIAELRTIVGVVVDLLRRRGRA